MKSKATLLAKGRNHINGPLKEIVSTHLARFIRECRLSRGLTTRQIEKMTKDRNALKPLTHSNLAAIEQGRYIPRFDDILSLSMVLGTPVQQFEEKLKLDMLESRPLELPRSWKELMKLGTETMEMGEFDDALAYFRKASEISSDSQTDMAREIKAKLNIINCLQHLGLSRIAKDEIEELLTRSDLQLPFIIRCNFILGDIYRSQRNFQLARLHLEAACRQAEGLDDLTLQGEVYKALADLYADQGQYGKAATLNRKALKNFKDTGELRHQITTEISLGMCMAEICNYEELFDALRLVESGLKKARKKSYKREISLANLALTKIHYRHNNLNHAIQAAEEAKEIAQEEDLHDIQFQSLFYLWEAAKQKKKTQLAQVYFERLRQLYEKVEHQHPEVQAFEGFCKSGE
ncbi:helix-turn-helix domain-containing protein [Acidobacteriota bacterium]